MNLIQSLNIGRRLGAAFAVLIALAIAVTLVGLGRMSELNQSLSLISADRLPKVMKLVDITDDVNLIARQLRNTLIFDDKARVDDGINSARQARDRIAKAFDELAPTITTDEGKARLAATLQARAVYVPLQAEFITLVEAGKKEEARVLLAEKMRDAQLAYMKALDDFKDLQVALIKTAATEGEASYAQARWLMLGLLAGIAASGALLGLVIGRSITRPIAQAVVVAERVAAGDLNARVEVTTRDETGRLLRSLQRMTASLADIVSKVRAGSDSIATGATQIAIGNADLSQRTEEQASALQQTAATMEELGSTVRNNADNAKQANQLAQGASTIAARGGEVVGQVVSTMQGISESSRRIGDIIGVIDGIAFQTNILALNAAVEAARAGEQGRGFAVVASEVRTLAQRSADAAKEIKSLIGRSVEQVEQGTVLVGQAGATMGEIVGSIRRVSDIVAEITSATVEQSSGIQQVGDAVGQMDQVTQQNAALVEESAAAAESLKGQAQQLVQAVAVFRLAGDAGAGAVPAPAAAPKLKRASAPRPAQAPKAARPAAAPAAAPPVAPAPAAAPSTAQDDWATF